MDLRIQKIADYVRTNWENLRLKFEDFYKTQFEIKLNEIQEVEELKNVMSTNLINCHLLYKKYFRMKEKISINEALPSSSHIIKNEEMYEKAILIEATRFNLLLEAKTQRAELDQHYREIKEQIAYYMHGLEYFEQMHEQKARIKPSIVHEYAINIGFMVLTAISIVVIFKIMTYLMF